MLNDICNPEFLQYRASSKMTFKNHFLKIKNLLKVTLWQQNK